jgi:uncharacterized membrane protein YccF (DUF307 family)
MNPMGNLLWLLFGGLFSAISYIVGGFALCLTIVGIPFGLQCFKIASFVLWPFGREAVSTASGGRCLTTLLNILWILFGSIWIALNHIIFGLLLFITLIGISFARQHFKLVEISLMPFGKRIVDK